MLLICYKTHRLDLIVYYHEFKYPQFKEAIYEIYYSIFGWK